MTTRFALLMRQAYAPARASGSHAGVETLFPDTEESSRAS
jgi:hypothetical protein